METCHSGRLSDWTRLRNLYRYECHTCRWRVGQHTFSLCRPMGLGASDYPEQRTVDFLKNIVTRIYAAPHRIHDLWNVSANQVLPAARCTLHSFGRLVANVSRTRLPRNVKTWLQNALEPFSLSESETSWVTDNRMTCVLRTMTTIPPDPKQDFLAWTVTYWYGTTCCNVHWKFLPWVSRGQGCHAQATGISRKRRTRQTVFPPASAKRHTPSDHWRRYRTITFVYALSEEGTYRRNPGQHLAEDMRENAHDWVCNLSDKHMNHHIK